MKPTNCPARGEKNKQEKRKKRGREKGKILLCAHARTSQADILHLDQKSEDREVYDR